MNCATPRGVGTRQIMGAGEDPANCPLVQGGVVCAAARDPLRTFLPAIQRHGRPFVPATHSNSGTTLETAYRQQLGGDQAPVEDATHVELVPVRRWVAGTKGRP